MSRSASASREVKPKLHKKGEYRSAGIYQELVKLTALAIRASEVAPRQLRYTIGQQMVLQGLYAIHLFRSAYRDTDKGRKVDKVEQLLETIDGIRDWVDIGYPLHYFGRVKMSDLLLQWDKARGQADTWHRALAGVSGSSLFGSERT